MEQHYINLDGYVKEITMLMNHLRVRHIFFVCGKSFQVSDLYDSIDYICTDNGIEVERFSDFSPNPRYEDVQMGVRLFQKNKCDFIFAAGGGSAIDVAKCIKLFAKMAPDENYLKQKIVDNEIPLLAIPTTAGTGSEATRFAVIYVNGEKYSVEHESALPQYVLLYPDSLKTLGNYQRKTTVCDALSHAIESYWSVHATIESKRWAEKAMKMILKYIGKYMEDDNTCREKMLLAANYAGRAINITKTTAAHAMCYKLTTLYHIPHGHAVMLCLPEVWEYLYHHTDECVDVRGIQYLQETLDRLAHCLQQNTCQDAIDYLKHLRHTWGLDLLIETDQEQLMLLVNSINTERLGNFPVSFSKEDLTAVYHKILRG